VGCIGRRSPGRSMGRGGPPPGAAAGGRRWKIGWPGTGRPGAGRIPPMGTPGWTGGGVGRIGALYTGRGPVCGTIMRGAGGWGAAGREGTVATGGAAIVVCAVVETGGAADTTGGAGGGAAGRTGGALTGTDATGEAATGGADGGTIVGRGVATKVGCCTGAEVAGGGATSGLTGGGATVAGRLTAAGGATAGLSSGGAATGIGAGRGAGGGAAASFFCVIARRTSPGREIFDRSILVLISSSPRNPRELDLLAAEEPSAEERMYTRTFSASCSSSELEWVFFSVTPTSGSVSRIARLFTSSSRARSLIRTLLIRPFVAPRFS
jgi:hypothetical protein